MEVYKYISDEDGNIYLQKNIIDESKYKIIKKNNGDILLKKIKEIKLDIESIPNYDFNSSTITNCVIDDKIFNKLKYKPILEKILSIIGDGSKIIKNTKLNIKTIQKEDKGFYYLENLGISIQGVDSNKCINEIVNQCIHNNIKLKLNIKLSNGDKIIINF